MTDISQDSALREATQSSAGSVEGRLPEDSAFAHLIHPCLLQLVEHLALAPAIVAFTCPEGRILDIAATAQATAPRVGARWSVPSGWRHAEATVQQDNQPLGTLLAASAAPMVDTDMAALVDFAAGMLERQIRARGISSNTCFEMIRQVSRFTAHALGNPLAGVSLTMELLASNPTGPNAGRFIERSRRILDRLGEFKENLGALGGGPAELQALDAHAWLTQQVQTQSLEAYKPHIEVDPQAGPLAANPGLLATAMGYLLRNMTDAMPDGGDFGIRVHPHEGFVRLTVWDEGPGVPANLLPDLFRLPVSSRKRGGGMGLMLVRMIVEQLHAGRVFYEPRSPRGAAFHLDFPQQGAEGLTC